MALLESNLYSATFNEDTNEYFASWIESEFAPGLVVFLEENVGPAEFRTENFGSGLATFRVGSTTVNTTGVVIADLPSGYAEDRIAIIWHRDNSIRYQVALKKHHRTNGWVQQPSTGYVYFASTDNGVPTPRPMVATLAITAPSTFVLTVPRHTSTTSVTLHVEVDETLRRDLEISVNPTNIKRTLSMNGNTTAVLAPGTSTIVVRGIEIGTVHEVAVSATGYTTFEQVWEVEDHEHWDVDLVHAEGTVRRVVVETDPGRAIEVASGPTFLDYLTLGAYTVVGVGSAVIDLRTDTIYHIRSQIDEDVTRGAWLDADGEARQIDFRSHESVPDPEEPDPSDPVDPDVMELRVTVKVAGTLSYDNDGFLDEIAPVNVEAGETVDIVLPPPQLGCSGGVISFTPYSGEVDERRVTFVAGTRVKVAMGPMVVNVRTEGICSIYWDEDSWFTWLPGDGELKGMAEPDLSFVTSKGGYVNVHPLGKDVVLRYRVNFDPGTEVTINVTQAAVDEESDGAPINIVALLSKNWPIVVGALVIVGTFLVISRE